MAANEGDHRGEARFLARATAQAAHELNNCLAIVGEQGGLLSDLCWMLKNGRPLDPGRLEAVAEGVRRQVERASRLTGNLHALSHTLDREPERRSVAALAELTGDLFGRLADRAKVKLSVCAEAADAPFDGDGFALCRLLFACLERAVAVQPDGGEAGILAVPGPGLALDVVITGGAFDAGLPRDPEIAALSEILSLTVTLSDDGKTLKLAKTL